MKEYAALERKIIREDASWIPLFSHTHLYVTSERVGHFETAWNGSSQNKKRPPGGQRKQTHAFDQNEDCRNHGGSHPGQRACFCCGHLCVRQGREPPQLRGGIEPDRPERTGGAGRIPGQRPPVRGNGGPFRHRPAGSGHAGGMRCGGFRRRGTPHQGPDRPHGYIPGRPLRRCAGGLFLRRQPYQRRCDLLLLHRRGRQRKGARLLLVPVREGRLHGTDAHGRPGPGSGGYRT